MADIATKAFSGRDIHNNRVTVFTSTGSFGSKENGLNDFIPLEVLDTRYTDRLEDQRALFFSTIVVAGQSDVVADKVSDILTLVAGSNITITTNEDGITIASSGGGSGLSDGDKGDIVVSGTGTVFTIDTSVVSYAKIQDISATDKLLGRSSSGAGVVEEIVCTAAGRALLDDNDASDQRTTLGLGTLATQNGTSSGTNTGDQTDISGNAATVTTNANLTGHITSIGNATVLGSFTSAQLLAALTNETGTGSAVFATSPTLVTPILGTPTSGTLTNCTGTATGLTSGITNALKSATTTVNVSSATAPTSGQVLTATGTTAATWQTPSGGGGLSNFTESANTSSPNNSVNASRLIVVASSTHADFVIQPKGNGAIIGQLPDGAATGGNKRGDNAVDLQTLRSVNTNVASSARSVISGGKGNTASGVGGTVSGGVENLVSGDYSVISGGQYNTASGSHSVVSGGYTNVSSLNNSTISGGKNNTASNQNSTVSGGFGNTSSGDTSTVSGGRYNVSSGNHAIISGGISNTSSGNYSNIAGGFDNLASGSFSSITGGSQATTRGIYGCSSIASGRFGTQGDAQRGQYIIRCLTTNNTQTTLTSDQSTAGTTNQVVLPNNSSYTFRGIVICHRTDVVGTSSSFQFAGCIRRGVNAASTTLVAAVTPASIAMDAGAVSWGGISVTADTTNGCLKITFTGLVSTTIRSVCMIDTVEVTS